MVIADQVVGWSSTVGSDPLPEQQADRLLATPALHDLIEGGFPGFRGPVENGDGDQDALFEARRCRSLPAQALGKVGWGEFHLSSYLALGKAEGLDILLDLFETHGHRIAQDDTEMQTDNIFVCNSRTVVLGSSEGENT